MKSITTLIFSLTIFLQLNAQNNQGPCGLNIQHIFVMNGLVFVPENHQCNKPCKDVNFCENYETKYYIDGFEIPEDFLLDLHLKQKDVIDDKTCYRYEYYKNDTINCVITLNLFISLKIPIVLNGVELELENRSLILMKINADKIIKIKKKRSIFGKTIIEITTRP